MKICVLANTLSVHTQRWTKSYAEHGHEIHLISIRSAQIPGVEVHTVNVGPVNSKSTVWTLMSYFYLLLTARYLISRLKPDIVEACYAQTYGAIAAFANARPLVITCWGSDIICHNSPTKPWYLRVLLRYVMKRANLVFATSKFLAEKTMVFLPAGEGIKVIPFGVDSEVFVPIADNATEKSGGFCIGFVKTLSEKYGPDVLIRAMAKVFKTVPMAKLIMAGCGEMKVQLEQLAAYLGIADKIKLVGFIEHSQLPQLLQMFDIFVNPTVCHESFGANVLEASSCSVPVVASNVGGVPEVCIDGRTGILVEPNSPQALAEAIIKLTKDTTLRKKMGREGRKMVAEKYNWHDNVREKIKLFTEQI